MGFRAAEIHYFRVPRDLWELYLLRARQMGVDTVSTYIPWSWHELEDGRFDLTGETDDRRDLATFLGLARAFGCGIIAKPGPFVDAELLGGGVPARLARDDPTLIARRFDGEPFVHGDSHLPRVSVRHPRYVEEVGRWFDAVVPLLLEVQGHGSLVGVQVDNECPGDGFWSYDLDPPSPNRLDYADPSLPGDLSRAWPDPPPGSLDELAPFIELERLADEQMTGAVARFARMLLERGITAPLFHDLCCGPWEISATIADAGLLARATGWLGSNVYAEELRDPFVVHGEYGYSFEEYVHYAWWRPRLMRSLSPGRPVFVPEIASVDEVYLHAPLIGGTDAFCVYMLHQVPHDAPQFASYPAWAMEAPLREDGEPEPHFWAAKTLFLYQAAGGAALTRSISSADVALVYQREPERAASWAEVDGAGWPDGDAFGEQVRSMNSGRRTQELAQELVRRGVAFDVIDERFPPRETWREGYRVVLSADDPIPEDPTLRSAWTDVEGVDVGVRFGDEGSVFLTVVHRTPGRVDGSIRWRGGGEIRVRSNDDGPWVASLHVRDGAIRSAILPRSTVFIGPEPGKGWSFAGRLGAACRIGETLVLTAPTDGRFVLPFDGGPVTRLRFDGGLEPWDHRVEDLSIRYEARVGDSLTDCLFVGEPVEALLQPFVTFRSSIDARIEDRDQDALQRAFALANAEHDPIAAARAERNLRLLALAERVVR